MDLVTLVLACSLYADNSITSAMVKLGSDSNPLTITVHKNPSEIQILTFKTPASAIQFAQQEIGQKHVVDLGIMQIPSPWLSHYDLTLADVFRPCKNMIVATNILNHIADQCSTQACILSTYKTGDPQLGLDYATQITTYAQAHPFIKPPSIFTATHTKASTTTVEASQTTKNTDFQPQSSKEPTTEEPAALGNTL